MKNQDKLTDKWNHCIAQRARCNSPADPLDECFFPPGQCVARQMVLPAMDHGRGTCQVILAALMCAEEQPPTCDYKAPKKQVCTCTP